MPATRLGTPWRFKSSHPHLTAGQAFRSVGARAGPKSYQRLVSALGDVHTPPEDVFRPLFEALSWAVVLGKVGPSGRASRDKKKSSADSAKICSHSSSPGTVRSISGSAP